MFADWSHVYLSKANLSCLQICAMQSDNLLRECTHFSVCWLLLSSVLLSVTQKSHLSVTTHWRICQFPKCSLSGEERGQRRHERGCTSVSAAQVLLSACCLDSSLLESCVGGTRRWGTESSRHKLGKEKSGCSRNMLSVAYPNLQWWYNNL